MIHELSNTIQSYAWGSRTALAELRGAPSPSPSPEAELWMGAHPLAPSRLLPDLLGLDRAIASAPAEMLGPTVAAAHDQKLPFLLKLLAAREPLSLQAHPSREQARAGFAAEEAAGVALDAPHRSYKDDNHKPELLCALTEFWALYGFRDASHTLELLCELDVPELAAYRRTLGAAPNGGGIAALFSELMLAPAAERQRLAERTTAACRAQAAHGSRYSAELGWGARLGELYPGDVGVLVALMLNLIRLEPGEAIYLPAGNLHAYLGGTGVEVMASSDNVLRGGLTPKHVNVPELLRVLDFTPLAPRALLPRADGAEHVYDASAPEFRLSYFDVTSAPITTTVRGPEIWLVTSGEVTLVSPSEATLTLDAGRSAFVPFAARELRLRGSGRIFRAAVGHVSHR